MILKCPLHAATNTGPGAIDLVYIQLVYPVRVLVIKYAGELNVDSPIFNDRRIGKLNLREFFSSWQLQLEEVWCSISLTQYHSFPKILLCFLDTL